MVFWRFKKSCRFRQTFFNVLENNGVLSFDSPPIEMSNFENVNIKQFNDLICFENKYCYKIKLTNEPVLKNNNMFECEYEYEYIGSEFPILKKYDLEYDLKMSITHTQNGYEIYENNLKMNSFKNYSIDLF